MWRGSPCVRVAPLLSGRFYEPSRLWEPASYWPIQWRSRSHAPPAPGTSCHAAVSAAALNIADRGTTRQKVSKFGKDTLFGRPAQPDEIAPAYVFLASEGDSSFITGVVLEQMGKTTAG